MKLLEQVYKMSMENEEAVEKVVQDENIPDDWVCPI